MVKLSLPLTFLAALYIEAQVKMPSQTYFELVEMMETEVQPTAAERTRHACPVCRLTLAGVDRLLRLLSLENVNDGDTRNSLRQAGGFCNRHSYQWAELHDALGTAIIYEDLLRDAGRRIERGEFAPRRAGLWGRASAPESPFAPCPLCLQQAEIEGRIVAEFAEGWDAHPRFRQAYSAAGVAGLCLSHYRQAAAPLEGGPAEELGNQQRAKLAATQAHLRVIIEKMDAGRKLEHLTPEERTAARAIGEEREALTRAIWQLAGLEDVR